ncbi:hypothetical protein [Paraburkholderia tropica]|uniref:hypothetical protein n=1 Tax=Paraburkholderia tropica TaxID=92647 RepID=UPI002AB6D4DA|nr:hypothetical protein [Paraburkholderia tropica]
MTHVSNYEALIKLGLNHDEVRHFVENLNGEIDMHLENQMAAMRAYTSEQLAAMRVHSSEQIASMREYANEQLAAFRAASAEQSALISTQLAAIKADVKSLQDGLQTTRWFILSLMGIVISCSGVVLHFMH